MGLFKQTKQLSSPASRFQQKDVARLTPGSGSSLPKLPDDLILDIITFALLSLPAEDVTGSVRVFKQVARNWYSYAQKLKFLNVLIAISQDDCQQACECVNRLEEGLKGRRAICRALTLKIAFKNLSPDPEAFWPFIPELTKVTDRLFLLVGPSLERLIIHSKGWSYRTISPDPSYPEKWPAIDNIPIPFSLPRLTELKTFGIGGIDIRHILRAVNGNASHLPPSSIYIRHDFETYNERHLLSLPSHVLTPRRTIGGYMFPKESLPTSDHPPNLRPPLAVSIDRRIYLTDLVEALLLDGPPYSRFHYANIWIKDAEEMMEGLDKIIRREKWRSWIEWDVLPSDTRSGINWCDLVPKLCKKVYACRCKSDMLYHAPESD